MKTKYLAVSIIALSTFVSCKKAEQNQSSTTPKVEIEKWVSTPFDSKTRNIEIQKTIVDLESSFSIIQKDASEDSNLLKLLDKYKAKSSSSKDLLSALTNLRDKKIDIVGMAHDGFGVDDKEYIKKHQREIADMVAKKYDFMFTEDFCDGELISLQIAAKQVHQELSTSALLNTVGQYYNENDCGQIFLESKDMFASNMIVFEGNKKVFGVDFSPLKRIQQHLLSYAGFYEIGKLPSDINPELFSNIFHNLSAMRDIYFLKYISTSLQDNDKTAVLVIGANHLPHLFALMSHYRVKGSAHINSRFFLQDEFQSREKENSVFFNRN